jgi:Tfp pilus assembly protein PilO
MMIKKIDYNTKIIIAIVATILFSGSILFAAINIGLGNIKNIQDKIIINRLEMDKQYKKSLGQKKLMAKLKMVESELKKVDLAFVNKNRMLEFITTLEGVAADNHIEQKISLGSDTAGMASYSKVPISINLNGQYMNTMNYLEQLESMDYYIDISSLSMEATPDNIYTLATGNIYIK